MRVHGFLSVALILPIAIIALGCFQSPEEKKTRQHERGLTYFANGQY